MSGWENYANKLIAFLAIVFFLVGRGVLAEVPAVSSDLRGQIEKKAKELQEIQAQREAVERTLDEIGKSSDSLKKEIRVIDGNISQLNLSIKANKLTVDKLDLEINSLGEDAAEIEKNIENKRSTLLRLFTELQEKDRENFFVLFLKNKSLSESVGEVQTIERLNSTLARNVTELRELQADLASKLNLAQTKRNSKEIERINLANHQQIVQEQKTAKQKILSETKNQERVYETQLEEIEKFQDKISAEVEKIEAELRKTIDPNLLPIPRRGLFFPPVAGSRVTQGYGSTPFALRNYRGKFHNGLDFGAPLGTEVFAAHDGTVINSGDQDKFCYRAGYGKFVVIKHDNGLTTLYAHFSKYIVKVGERISRGQVIGYVGRTGYATGPHVHLTVFASQTLAPARPGFPEGTRQSSCGPMPVGGDLDPAKYL